MIFLLSTRVHAGIYIAVDATVRNFWCLQEFLAGHWIYIMVCTAVVWKQLAIFFFPCDAPQPFSSLSMGIKCWYLLRGFYHWAHISSLISSGLYIGIYNVVDAAGISLVSASILFPHFIRILPLSHIELMCVHIIIIYKKAFRIFLPSSVSLFQNGAKFP